jgi:LuxR family transcriptional activator of conjugal transfer of Ti plasmids
MTKIPQTTVARFLQRISFSHSNDELDTVLYSFVRLYDFSFFSLVRFPDIFSKNFFMEFFSTYPDDWKKHYTNMQYQLHDPVFTYLGHVHLPFLWNKHTFPSLTSVQKQLFLEAESFGVEQGLCIPLGVFLGGQSFVLIPNEKRLYAEKNYTISLICQAYEHKRHTLTAKAIVSALSPREVEILRLRYSGNLIKDVCKQLGISKSTVTFHLENAKKKLEAKNVNEALMRFWQIEHTF